MLAVTMKSGASQIQTRSLQNHALTQSPSSIDSSEQMLVASRSPLSPSKRPKLSLQTSSVPVAAGKSTTALSVSLSALQSASPTVRNTFNNAYDIPLRPSPIGTSPSTKWPKPISSTIPKREEQPYELPPNLKGILRNPPYMSPLRRSALTATNSASPRTGRRIFFPPTKKVTYRTPLDEEIKTFKFTARHSDLSSEESDHDTSDCSTSDGRNHGRSEEFPIPRTPIDGKRTESNKKPIRSPGLKHSKRKRKLREWRWTIDPLLDDEIEEDEGNVATLRRLERPSLSINTTSPIAHPDAHEERARKTPFPYEVTDK